MQDDYLTDESAELPPRPPFLNRLWMVFGVPGALFTALARNPAWFPMALFVAAISGASLILVPAEAFLEMIRQGQSPEQAAQTAEALAAFPPVALKGMFVIVGALGAFVLPILFSLVTFVVFVFIRGDEARFRQHLSVAAHTGVITGVGGILTMGVALGRGGSLDQTISVGTFLHFLPEGYVAGVMGALGLFGIWVAIVLGIGVAAIDPRRSTGSTVGIMLVLMVVWALVRGAF